MKEYIEYIIAGAAMLALVSNLRLVARSNALSRDPAGWTATVLIVLGGLLYEARLVPIGQATQLGFFGALVGLLIVAISLQSRGHHKIRPRLRLSVYLPACIAGILFLTNAVMNVELPLGQSFGRLLAIAILATSATIISIGRLQLIDLCRIVIVSLLIILIVSPFVSSVWRACDIFKCGPFGGIYTGPFSSENALAIFGCVALMCQIHAWSKLSGILTIAPIGLALYATESRTSQLALAGALIAWCVSVLWRSLAKRSAKNLELAASGRTHGQVTTFSVICFALFVLGFVLIVTADPSSFSNRGNVWIRGMAALGEAWPVGLGLDRWSYLQTIGLLPPLFPHSQYLLLLFGGGVIAVVLMFVLIFKSLVAGSRSISAGSFSVGYAVFLAILGLTEAYWNPIAYDGHTWLVLPLIFVLLSDAPERVSGRSTSESSVDIDGHTSPFRFATRPVVHANHFSGSK